MYRQVTAQHLAALECRPRWMSHATPTSPAGWKTCCVSRPTDLTCRCPPRDLIAVQQLLDHAKPETAAAYARAPGRAATSGPSATAPWPGTRTSTYQAASPSRSSAV